MQGISISVSYEGEDREIVIISVNGYVDATTAPELRRVVTEQVAIRKYKIIIDLQGVDYISSTGWGVFIGELKDIRMNEGDLVLVGMVTNVYNIYELMEFSSIIKSFTDVDMAKAHFLGAPASREQKTRGQGAPARGLASGMGRGPAPEPGRQGTAGSGVQGQGAPAAKAPQPEPAQAEPAGRGGAQPGIAWQDRKGDVKDRMQTGLFTSSAAKEKREKNRAIEQTMAYSIGSYRNEVLNISGYTLGKAIVKVVMDKPYLGVKEITKALELPQYGGHKHKARDVKHELKQMGLLSQRERYEFVMQDRPPQEYGK